MTFTEILLKIIIPSLTLLAAISASFFSFRANKKTIYINTITSERIKWLSFLKSNMSKFIATCYRLAFDPGEKTVEDITSIRTSIILCLNPKEDEAIIDLLYGLTSKTITFEKLANKQRTITKMKEIKDVANKLVASTQAKCKFEWERIKREAQHIKVKEPTYAEIKKEINELYNDYLELQ